jgi:hypothetical protein
MSTIKRMREALAMAEKELAERSADLRVRTCRGSHARLIVGTRDGRITREVHFASTPSCDRWLVHLKKDLRRELVHFGHSPAGELRDASC